MSKYCPLLNRKVVYLECTDCDEKICEKTPNEPPGLFGEPNDISPDGKDLLQGERNVDFE